MTSFVTVNAGTVWIKGKIIKCTIEKISKSTETKSVSFEDSFSQTIDFCVNSTQTDEILNPVMLNKNNDPISPRMHAFLQKNGKYMLDQLERQSESNAFAEYDMIGDEEDDKEISKLFTFVAEGSLSSQISPDTTDKLWTKLQCTGVSWNATGSTLAVSFGRLNHSGWCNYRGAVCLWNVFSSNLKQEKPDVVLEVSSGAMCIACHPMKPAVFAAGSFNGEIFVWDTSYADSHIACSQIGDYFHREPIMKLSWFYNNEEKDYNIVSVSGEGKVLVWSLKSKLVYPFKGFQLCPPLEKRNRHNKGAFVAGGLSLALSAHPRDHVPCIVGTEGGSILKSTLRPSYLNHQKYSGWDTCSSELLVTLPEIEREKLKLHVQKYSEQRRIKEISVNTIYASKPDLKWVYPNGIDFQYESHSGPVYDVDYSPFHRNLFLTCGADGNVQIFHLHQRKPLLSIEVSMSYLFAVEWSKTRPMVFAVGSEDGNVYVYDLQQNEVSPVATLEGNNKTPIHTVQFNPKQRNFLACGDANGHVILWKLSWQLSNIQPNELTDSIVFGNREEEQS